MALEGHFVFMLCFQKSIAALCGKSSMHFLKKQFFLAAFEFQKMKTDTKKHGYEKVGTSKSKT